MRYCWCHRAQSRYPILLEGLRRLEYRGYDSAGLAVLDDSSQLQRVRRKGTIKELEHALETSLVDGKVGIAHTRWATHGIPSERNAHPHMCRESVAVVHNGIIENHEDSGGNCRKRDTISIRIRIRRSSFTRFTSFWKKD